MKRKPRKKSGIGRKIQVVLMCLFAAALVSLPAYEFFDEWRQQPLSAAGFLVCGKPNENVEAILEKIPPESKGVLISNTPCQAPKEY